jgi:hypothetical protein
MRELGANAKDAHEMAGKPTAVWECHIPTRLEPYFGVRDYGTGLSHAFMMDNYTDIGYSDKRDSDDAIGGFGIGRLSAFSYTDAYTVESIQSGQQRIYSVHLGSAGIPVVVQLGNTLHTTEPDGFHVKVPVKDDDLYTFEDKGKRVYAHFDPQPKFNKEDYAFKKQIQVMGPDKTWWVDAGQNSFKVVMGGVAYPVSNGEIGVSPYSYNLNLTMEFPIGGLDITPSRESLKWTDRTSEKIKGKYELVKMELLTEAQKEIDKATSQFDACRIARTALHTYNTVAGSSATQPMKLTYKGSEVSTYFRITHTYNSNTTPFSTTDFRKIPSYNLKYHKRPAGYYAPKIEVNPTQPSDIYITTTKDLRVPSRLKEHYQNVVPNTDEDVFIIKTDDVAKTLKELKDTGYPDDNIYILADVVADVQSHNGGGVRTTRPSGSIYSVTMGNLMNNYNEIKSNVLFTAENDLDPKLSSGVYVDVSGWQITSNSLDWNKIKDYLNDLHKMKVITSDTRLYVALKTAKNPFGPSNDWTEFETFCQEKLDEFETLHTTQELKRQYKRTKQYNSRYDYGLLDYLLKDEVLPLLPPRLKRLTTYFKVLDERYVDEGDGYVNMDGYVSLYKDMKGDESPWYEKSKESIYDKVNFMPSLLLPYQRYDCALKWSNSNYYASGHSDNGRRERVIELLTMIENSSKL